MLNDLISIIVPVFNLSTYLQNSIGSLQKQSYKNIEIIAVDDGSSDDSLTVLQKMAKADDRIQVIHQKNGGVTKARLAGVAAATGEWIGFMDGDDYVEPDMYERLLQNAKEYNAHISHCGYQMVFPSRVDYYYNTGRLMLQDQETGLKDLLEGSFIEPGLCNKLFHKALFHNLLHKDVMDTSIRNFEDLLMNYYLFREANSAVYEDFCPYHYMLREGSAATSSVNEHKLVDPLIVLKTIKKETMRETVLQMAIDNRIVNHLISLATVPIGKEESIILPYQSSARKELINMLPRILRGKYSIRTKVMSMWAGIWPSSYQALHSLHRLVVGNKYEVR